MVALLDQQKRDRSVLQLRTVLDPHLLHRARTGIDRPANLRPPEPGWRGVGVEQPGPTEGTLGFAEPMERVEGA